MDQEWQQLSEQILTDIKEWRRSHPKATLREIEEEVYSRLSRLEARVIQDTAQQSECRDWSARPPEERPTCPVCGTPLQAHPAFASRRRAADPSNKKLWHLLRLWGRTFSPSMSN